MPSTPHIEQQIELSGVDPVIIAVDVSETMGVRDQRGRSRMLVVHDELGALIKRLPRETPITVLTFGDTLAWHCHDASPTQARAALMLAQAHAVGRCTGDALEHAMRQAATYDGEGQYVADSRFDRHTMIVATDGPPSDLMTWQAYAHLNVARGEPVALVVLGMGGYNPSDLIVPGARRAVAAELGSHTSISWLIRTDTGSNRPRIDTVPPSLAPPSSPPRATAHDFEPMGYARAQLEREGFERTERRDPWNDPHRRVSINPLDPTDAVLVLGDRPHAMNPGANTTHPAVLDIAERAALIETEPYDVGAELDAEHPHDAGGTEYVDVERHAPVPAAPPAPDPAPPSPDGAPPTD